MYLLTVVLIIKTQLCGAACSAGVIAGLSAIYHASNGANWGINSNWMDYTNDPCEGRESLLLSS